MALACFFFYERSFFLPSVKSYKIYIINVERVEVIWYLLREKKVELKFIKLLSSCL